MFTEESSLLSCYACVNLITESLLKNINNFLDAFPQSIPLSKYPAVLWQSLETDIFSEIISILHKDYVW